MSDRSQSADETHNPGWNELIEDAVGVNLRGMKTLWVSITKPAYLFTVARTPHWNGNQYSPTLRVWMFLLALVMFFQFLWASPDSLIGQTLQSVFADANSDNPILREPETLELALQRYVFVYPVALLVFFLLTALLFRIWGKGTTIVTRIRLFFAAILPSSLVVLITSPLIAVIPNNEMSKFLIGSFVIIFLADLLTIWRGLVPVYNVGARTWRAVLFATCIQIVYQIASGISALIMVLWIGRELGIETALNPG